MNHDITRITVVLVMLWILTVVFPIQLVYTESLSFEPAINVSNSNDPSSGGVEIAAYGNNVYIIWLEGSAGPDGSIPNSNLNLFFRASKDNGKSFDNPIKLGTSRDSLSGPKIAASGENVYVVWVDDKDVLFTRSTDQGSTFSSSLILASNNKGVILPWVVAYGKNVYVAWEEGEIVPSKLSEFGNAEIFIRVSNDNGETFGPAINLSNNASYSTFGNPWGPKIAAYRNDVYVVWQDLITPSNFDIFLARSTDNGSTFDVINLSNNSGGSVHPTVAAFGNGVYVAYQDDTHTGVQGASYDVFFTRSTDRGENFESPINMSKHGISGDPKIVVSGKNVYMIWKDASSGDPKIFFARSTDNGKTFDHSINLTGNGLSVNAWLAVSGNSAYVGWQEKVGNKIEAFFRASTDYGANFEPAINLSKGFGDSAAPKVAASEDGVYVTWIDNGVGNTDIFFRAGTNPSFKSDPTVVDIENEYIKNSPKQPTQKSIKKVESSLAPIAITSVNNSKPRWGLDEVIVSGTVSEPSSLDTITIDWGDDTISNVRIIQQNGSWGPVGHTYDVEHVGKKQIVAKLFSGRMLKANSTYEIDVQKHATSITIDQISNIKPGSPITVTGSLIDTDAKVGVRGRLITFNATGIEDLSSTVTFRDGVFSSKGAIPTKPNNIAVQAQFEGDNVYLPSISSAQKYDTVETITESMVQLSNIALVDSDGNRFNKILSGDQVLIQGNLVNKQNKEQPITYIIQIKDNDENTVFLSWVKASIENNQSMKVAVAWTPDTSGNYTVEIFVWESMTNPIPLSELSRIKLSVT